MTTRGKIPASLPGSRQLWAMLWVALGCAAVFIAITTFVFDEARGGAQGPAGPDRDIALFLQQFRSPAITGRVIEVSALGSAPVLIVLALFTISVILRAKDWLGLAHLTVTLVGGAVWARVLQHIFDRARPEDLLPLIVVTKGSYPSAHLFGATAAYLTFAIFHARYVAGRVATIVCYVATSALIVCIGLTRVYLGAHHTTDVAAGIAAGAAWAFLVAAGFTALYGAGTKQPAARASR